MRHRLFLITIALLVWSALAGVAGAEEVAESTAWPYIPFDPDTFRGPGFYFNIYKIAACWLLFLCWTRTADWINQDLQFHQLRIHTWNPIVVGSFSLALLLMWILPFFWLGFILLLGAYAGPLLTYVFYYRNPLVDDHKKVLTPDHLRFWASEKLKYVGIRIKSERPAAHEISGPVPIEMLAVGGASKQDDQAASVGARQLPGYSATAMLLDDANRRRASAALLTFADAVGVRYMIDGVWHNLSAQPLEAGNQVIEVLSLLAGLGIGTPAQKANGRMAIKAGKEEMSCTISHTTNNEATRWLIQFQRESQKFEKLSDLGMREKVAENLAQRLEATEGLLIFSALPNGGLTTMIDVALRQVDCFIRDFVSIEDEDNPESEVVNVDRRTYNAAAGESPADILGSVVRASPDVIVCRNMVNAESVKMLCEQAADGNMIISSIVAKDSVEALLRVLVMKVPPAVFVPAISTVVHGRLIRKLCEECREAYAPSPALLKKLGIPAGKIEHLYRTPQDRKGPICSNCDGIGYYGRTGMYELLVVDDAIGQILASGKPQLETLRKAARQAGLQTEMEHGILLVARGVTSVDELQRALKS